MFEIARLSGTPRRRIALQTRAGNDIDNEQEQEPVPQQQLAQYTRVKTEHGRNWTERKAACGIYNCAGHVWASRRTSIMDEPEWAKIIEDDGYRPLRAEEPPEIGDLVVYKGPGIGYLHVGQIVEVSCLGNAPVPKVLSKLDGASGEVLHRAMDMGHLRRLEFKTVYITDRPLAEGKR